jgi:pilus assembly protein CpaB
VNPRQRRGVLLLVLAGLGAVIVFVLVAGYVSDVRSEVDPKVAVVKVTRDVPAFTEVTEDALETEEIPEKWAPATAIGDPAELTGLVSGTDIPAGSIVQEGMLIDQPELGEEQREIAILVDAETGVAGKIGPGSIVDIFATFSGGTCRSEIVVTNARVVDVGVSREQSEQQQTGELVEEDVLPVTFALSVQEAQILTAAESFADEVRLALLRPGSEDDVPSGKRIYDLGPCA